MNKPPKQCQHLNIVQVGNPGIIETFCTDCNERIRVVKIKECCGRCIEPLDKCILDK